jgi:hypothetical protein
MNNMREILVTVVVLLFLLSSNVAADDATSIEVPKSRRTAVIYSLVSTSVPVVVGGVMIQSDNSAPLGTGIASLGLILGPGVGHVYAGNSRRFWTGAGTRGLVLASSVAVATILIDDSVGESWDEGLPKALLAIAIVGAGVTICTISAVRDIGSADNSVDAYNSARGFRTLSLSPAYFAHYKAPGFVLNLTF